MLWMVDNGKLNTSPSHRLPGEPHFSNESFCCPVTHPAISEYPVIFEHPLNERIRTFLRLEHLFNKTEFFSGDDGVWATRTVIDALFDIVQIATRGDMRGELLRELERQNANLGRIQEQPGVNRKALDQTLKTLGDTIGQIQQIDGQMGQMVREDEMLRTVAQRSGIPGGTCSFDLPQFHHWLQRPHAERTRQIALWMAQLLPVRDAIRVVLSFIRDSNTPTSQVARQGFFQYAMDPQAPIQMIRVGIPEQGVYFPEISGHKHRFTIRFLQVVVDARPTQTPQDICFSLTRCMI